MNYRPANPSLAFYKVYEESILNTRSLLFEELSQISPEFATEARKILEAKLKSNDNNPLMGELFPWIIKDLIEVNSDTTSKISVGWLAIYIYTIFLDEYLDSPKPLNPSKFITASLLAKTGLLRISHFTNNTPYEKYVDNAFSFSAKNQYFDTKFQKDDKELDFKEKYSIGKNHILLICAGALAAQNSKHSEFITKFTESLLLAIQYLDDITDFKEDYDSRNLTVLLNDALQNNSIMISSFKSVTRRELLSELISTGALQRVLEKILVLLNQSISLINLNRNSEITKNKVAAEFFESLYVNTTILNKYLQTNLTKFNYSETDQAIILDKTEHYIKLIAESS